MMRTTQASAGRGVLRMGGGSCGRGRELCWVGMVEAGRPSGGCLSRWSQEVTRELVVKTKSGWNRNVWKVNVEGIEGGADLEGRGQA